MILTKHNKEILKLMGLDDPGTLLGMELDTMHAMFETMDGRRLCYIADRELGFATALFLGDGKPRHGFGPGTPKAVFMKTLKALDHHKGAKRVSMVLTTKDGESLIASFGENTNSEGWAQKLSSDYCTKYRLHRLSDLKDILFGATA